MCMNLMEGGQGGFISKEQQFNRSSAGGKATSLKMKNDEEFSEHFKNQISKGCIDSKIHKSNWESWNGKKHSPETIEKFRNRETQKGELNSQFGTVWISKSGVSKKIKKTELEVYIENGWKRGRK